MTGNGACHSFQHPSTLDDSGRGSTSGQASALVAELEEFLLSVYHGEGEAEVGIFGLRFSNGKAAQRAASLLRAQGGEGSEVHLKGSLVVGCGTTRAVAAARPSWTCSSGGVCDAAPGMPGPRGCTSRWHLRGATFGEP